MSWVTKSTKIGTDHCANYVYRVQVLFFCFFYFWIILHFRMYLFFLLLFRSVSLFHWLSCLVCCGYCCCISLTLLLLSSRETHVRVYRMNYFLLETMYIYSNIYAVSFAWSWCVCVCVCVYALVRVYVSVYFRSFRIFL